MLSTPHPAIVALKFLTATTAPYCYPHDVPMGDWLANYAKTRSEYDPPDDLTVYHLAEALSLAFEKMIPVNPQGAAELVGKLFDTFDTSQHVLLRSIVDRLYLKPNVLALAPLINDAAKYAFAALLFVICRETLDRVFLAQVCKINNRTFEEEVAVHEQNIAERGAKVSAALHALGFSGFEGQYAEDTLHYHLGKTLFGDAWAELYAATPLSVPAIIQEVLHARPPFANSLKPYIGKLPESYCP